MATTHLIIHVPDICHCTSILFFHDSFTYRHQPGGRQAVAHSPTFTDYLKLAANLVNPYTYLKEPLNEVGSRLGDLVDILGSGSKSFIDSMAGLANTVGDGFSVRIIMLYFLFSYKIQYGNFISQRYFLLGYTFFSHN